MFKTLFSLLLLLAHSGGQGQAPLTNPGDECVLKGVVADVAGGEPLLKAVVSLCQAADSTQCTGAVTDATGQFEVKTTYPGRYILSATCTGYVEQQYGQRKPGGSGEILDLSPGRSLSGLSIRLIPAAAVYGKVYDENGSPVADAVVSELHIDYTHGLRQLRAGAVARTNDLGEYRVWGLTPGTHFILAEYNLERLTKVHIEIGYLPTFYPNVLDAAHAAPIVVQAGDQYSGADINLQPARTVQVRGHIYGGGSNVRVFLLLRDFTAFGDLVPPVYAQERDGDYQLQNVTPGAYYLYAFGQDSNGPVVNRQPVEVTDADLEDVDMILRRSFNLSGSVSVEGSASPPPIQVSLLPRNGRMILGQAPSTWTTRFGAFNFENVYPGDYDLQIEDIAAPFYLESARMGGYDVLARGISTDLHGGRIDIFIGRNGATIYGTVSKDQQPYSSATVVLVPDAPHREDMHLYKLTGTDSSGRFVIGGVAPGDYKVFAWESVVHAAYTNSDFLQAFELRGESVHVSERSRVTVNLDLIPEADVAQ